MATPREQFDRIARVSSEIVPEEEFLVRLKESAESGRPLRVKYGMDPTAPDIHVGNAVALHKLRMFQDFGHQAVLIIGDATAMVGDPSGQDETRPMLTEDSVRAFAQTYLDQVGKIVDLERAEVRYNREWFAPMPFDDVLALLSRMTVARMLERDSFSKRYEAGQPIGIHEFVYCLMQGHDSVAVTSDVELGGTDQKFNLMVGRELQKQAGQRPQVCILHPLLEGTDGKRKMSKSLNNAVGITDEPNDMYGKIMSLPDEMMAKYFTYAAFKTRYDFEAEIGKVHPKQVKDRLAREVVALYHDSDAADAASAEFDRVHARRELPEEMPDVVVPADEIGDDGKIWIVKLVVLAGFAKSNGEARRLVQGGGVSLDGEKVSDVGDVPMVDGQVLKVGKRRFARVRRGS